jgi:hypothetical protein
MLKQVHHDIWKFLHEMGGNTLPILKFFIDTKQTLSYTKIIKARSFYGRIPGIRKTAAGIQAVLHN